LPLGRPAACRYVISCHGAIIFGPKGVGPARPLVKSWALASDLLRTAVQLAQDTDTLLMLYTATGIHSCGRADHNLTFVNGDGEPMGEWWSRVGEFPIPIEGHPVFEALPPHLKEVVRASPLTPNSRHFATFEEVQAFIDGSPDEPIFKAILVAEPPRISATLAAAHGAIPRHVGNVMGPFEGWMEIIHPEANKAVAVEWLCQKVGTTLEHAITLGDGLNDLEMLQQAGLGIAMANAVTEAKQAANVVSRFTNHESAVAKELQRLVDAGFLPP
jgi:hydroxymethylpyrimidine pyrophosphatase-like HAD family hydrolase